MNKNSKKKKIKNNSFRKNYKKKSRNCREKSKKYRKKRKTYHKISHKDFKKIYKKNLTGTQVGGSHVELPVPHRIGFELEACFDGEVSPTMRTYRSCMGLRSPKGADALNLIFGKKLNYFDATSDTSIQCPGPNSIFNVPAHPSRCGMELILKNDNIFTYNDKEIYMDDMPITSNLIDEILLISSKANACQNGSCGFHVHISETDTPENRGLNNLNQMGGKLFLLRALALWCGILGITQSKQDEFIEKGYCRPEKCVHGAEDEDEICYAKFLSPLENEEFKSVYDLAMRDKLTNEKLLDYLKKVYKLNDSSGRGVKNHAFNIYGLSQLIEFDGRSEGRSRDHLSEPEKKIYDRLWGTTLRIEFRGHKDLMETISDKTDLYHQTEGYDIAAGARRRARRDEAVSMMIDRPPRPEPETEPEPESEPTRLRGHARAEHTRNLAKASRFYDHLMEYLEEINKFFTEAKTYEPF